MTDTVTSFALDLREIVNIFISVISAVMTVMFASYTIDKWRDYGLRNLTMAAKGAAACALLAFGEFLRSATVWEILHFNRIHGTYSTQIIPLIGTLLCICVGGLYIIRVFSPFRIGHWLWIVSLIVACTLAAISMVEHLPW